MSSDHRLTADQLLALEEQQLHYFLRDVRPVGEEKSELYPEPQYFNTSFIAVAAHITGTIDKILARCGSTEAYARRLRRVLSPATALHVSGLAFLATWGREMWLLDEPGADRHSGVIARGAPTLSDADVAQALRFSYEVACGYRRDGQAYPSATRALGTDYRILEPAEAATLAAAATPVEAAAAEHVLGLMAVVRALSFLMEAETREALMMHGPYPTADQGLSLVLFECGDLRWSLLPDFPLPGGVRWSLPERPFPVANLAIALVVKDLDIAADRFGTLYIDPLDAAHVVAASLLTRGSDAYTDEGLSTIPVTEARGLRRLCDDIQETLFLQIAGWTPVQRMAAGVYQENLVLLRMLAAAGWARGEVREEMTRMIASSAPILEKYFDRNFARASEELPFYRRLGAFIEGGTSRLFTPLTASEAAATGGSR